MCQFDDCQEPQRSRGWCETHYRRYLRSGDPAGTGKVGRPRGDSPTYMAIHLRLGRERGKAGLHQCDGCGKAAQAWSYNHRDPNEQYDAQDRPYSADLDCYSARCWTCHNALDRAHARRRRDERAAA